MKIITAILAFLISSSIYAQTSRLENTTFIYWQSKTAIQFSDYKKLVDSIDLKDFEKYKSKSLENIQIHSILDYPKKVKQIKTLKEKWYLAPVFCKECSAIIAQDSSDLKRAQIYFDIAEYCSRVTRIKIANIKKMKTYNDNIGFIAALFPGLVDKMYDLMIDMFSSYKREVEIEKQPNAQSEWRKTVDSLLDSTKEYSTSENECERFISDKPFSDEYKVSYELYGKN